MRAWLEMAARLERQEARNRRCGARTRAGTPCRAQGSGRGNRCKNHGGLCTGARSAEGRARIAAAQRKRWAAWRAQRARNEEIA